MSLTHIPEHLRSGPITMAVSNLVNCSGVTVSGYGLVIGGNNVLVYFRADLTKTIAAANTGFDLTLGEFSPDNDFGAVADAIGIVTPTDTAALDGTWDTAGGIEAVVATKTVNVSWNGNSGQGVFSAIGQFTYAG